MSNPLTTPIRINGTDFDPSKMDISIQSVSAADAGRDESGLMHVRYIATKYKIELEWLCPSPALTKSILKAVQPTAGHEYVSVDFVDPVSNSQQTKYMYVGDRNAPYQMWGRKRKFFSRVAFDLIEI